MSHFKENHMCMSKSAAATFCSSNLTVVNQEKERAPVCDVKVPLFVTSAGARCQSITGKVLRVTSEKQVRAVNQRATVKSINVTSLRCAPEAAHWSFISQLVIWWVSTSVDTIWGTCAPSGRNMHHQAAMCTMVHKGDYIFWKIQGSLIIFRFGGSCLVHHFT